MGSYLFDQYSLLHFSVGVIAYFFNIKLYTWIILHILFEITENSNQGIHFINKYLLFWPGGKLKSDSFLNIIGDNITAFLGWICAYYLDKIGNKLGWYNLHIK